MTEPEQPNISRNPTIGLAQALQQFGRTAAEAFNEVTFSMSAQAVIAGLLAGHPHDQIHARLEATQTGQLERINRAARELTAITDGILQDREIASEASKSDDEPMRG